MSRQSSGMFGVRQAKKCEYFLVLGQIYVAPPDFHLLLDDNGMRLSHGPKENKHRTAIDLLFRPPHGTSGRESLVYFVGSMDDRTMGLKEIKPVPYGSLHTF